MYQLPNLQEEMVKRVNLLVKAKKNKTLQQIEIELCKRGILYFCRNYLYTDKNTNLFTGDESSVIPFIPFEFQEELITEVWSSIINGTKPLNERTDLTNVFIEKSRQMGVSWLLIAIFIYGYIFHNHKYLMITQKEDDMDKMGDMKSLFQKARFILENLPTWMLPQGFSKTVGTPCNKFASISRTDGTGSITGESANANAGRGGTYNAVFLDEFAFVQNAVGINTSCASATPCRIFNSTPNGEGNEFYRMRKLTMVSKDDDGNDIPPQIKGLRYHRSDHPLYDEKWYEWKIRGMTKEKIAQELEISYNISIVGRVYTDFNSKPQNIVYNPEKPLYIAIDNSHGGADPHSLIIAQLEHNYINIIDSIELNCSVTDMAELCRTTPKISLSNTALKFLERYKTYNWQRATFIADPYDTHSTLNKSTIYEEYRKVGIHLNTPNERNKEEQIMKTRANMYRVRYNENCLDFASAIMNAKYPDRKENSNSTTENKKPIHDWTSHMRTALEFLIVYLLENPVADKKRVIEDTRPKRDLVTGRMIY